MIRAGLTFRKGFADEFKRFSIQRLERAALVGSDQASRQALREVRQAFGAAGASRLGGAIKQFSDLQKGKVHRRGAEAFSASGGLAIRTRNERTVGAVISYTEGGTILPLKGRWLWIATDEIPRLAGRNRMTPELYRKRGFEQKIGPLVRVNSVNGRPLLVVKNASVSAGGLPGRAKALTRRGGLRKGQRDKAFIVAFIGIPRTQRTQSVHVEEIMQRNATLALEIINSELQKGA